MRMAVKKKNEIFKNKNTGKKKSPTPVIDTGIMRFIFISVPSVSVSQDFSV